MPFATAKFAVGQVLAECRSSVSCSPLQLDSYSRSSLEQPNWRASVAFVVYLLLGPRYPLACSRRSRLKSTFISLAKGHAAPLRTASKQVAAISAMAHEAKRLSWCLFTRATQPHS